MRSQRLRCASRRSRAARASVFPGTVVARDASMDRVAWTMVLPLLTCGVLVLGCSPAQPASSDTDRDGIPLESGAVDWDSVYFAARPKLHPDAFSGADEYWSLAVDGDTAVIGTPYDGDEETWIATGAVVVLRRTGDAWGVEQRIL